MPDPVTPVPGVLRRLDDQAGLGQLAQVEADRVGRLAQPARVPSGVVAAAGMTLAGLSALALPWVPGFWSVLAVLGVGILGAPAVNAAMMSYFMHRVPRRVLGRALSGASVLTSGAVPLAPALAGFGLAWVGLRPTLVAAGVVCLAAVALVLTDRGLRALPRPDQWGEPAF